MDYAKLSIDKHRELNGKLEVRSRMSVTSKDELSVAYTPGVAAPCLEIHKDVNQARELTSSKKTVAVVSDGSAVLGLGDIGPEASLPVMEGKCVLFKEFGDVDAFPIVLNTQDVDEIVETVVRMSPGFGGINLEDIAAPRCFEIERKLIERLDIPVFHDDQHGTAVVVLAGLINAQKVLGKDGKDVKIVINGSGAAGVAIAKLLLDYGYGNIVMCDSHGIISSSRDNLNSAKQALLEFTNKDNISGTLSDAVAGRDVFIGVSAPNVLSQDDVRTMNAQPIIFAMANPNPEITPDDAYAAGAGVVATGRSDYPNQLNNVLVFPGIFRGAIDSGAQAFTNEIKFAAAEGLASLVQEPSRDKIIPGPFDAGVAEAIAKAVIDRSEVV
jgi:malate dehydrogenase (oxaloacetate-decarboxylating)